jgi:hypothetical protein
MSRRSLLLSLCALPVAACGGGNNPPAEQTTAQASAPEAAPATGSVTREAVTPPTEPAPAPAPAVIQQQPGPRGTQVALNRVAVTGDVMTVQLSYAGGSNGYAYVPVDRVSVIDDATAQQIGVLKDAQGRWLAAPLGGDGKELRIDVGSKNPSIVWFKVPAPPATSATVSINIPEVGPFDGVPVTR